MIRVMFPGLILALGLSVAGCSTDFPVTPTTTGPTQVTEPTFAGTLTPNGAITLPFVATNAGNVDITVMRLADSNGDAAIGPDGTLRIGLELGTWNGTVCYAPGGTLTNTGAFVSTVLTGYVTAAGRLCTTVRDPGDGLGNPKLTEPIAFELTITHY